MSGLKIYTPFLQKSVVIGFCILSLDIYFLFKIQEQKVLQEELKSLRKDAVSMPNKLLMAFELN